jgi:membrane fusion protein (multidrug efflux system)
LSDAEGYKAVSDTKAGDSFLRRWRWPLIIGGPLIILGVAGYFILTGGRFESTDDAYVDVAKAPVAASVPGRVIAVYVKENQAVAELQVRSLKATYGQQKANLQAAQSTAAYAAKEAARQKALVAAGVASQAQAAEAANTARQAADAVTAARQVAAAALANLNGDPNLPMERQPTVMAARAAVDRATLNQSYTVVTAPVTGVVTKVEQLQPGAYVNAAQTVFWLVSGQPWIEANFKESQLGKMSIGQPVEIKVDAYPKARLAGHVASFSPGTGQAFSALPAQNATGNWVKVTQRLPVRVEFDNPPP